MFFIWLHCPTVFCVFSCLTASCQLLAFLLRYRRGDKDNQRRSDSPFPFQCHCRTSAPTHPATPPGVEDASSPLRPTTTPTCEAIPSREYRVPGCPLSLRVHLSSPLHYSCHRTVMPSRQPSTKVRFLTIHPYLTKPPSVVSSPAALYKAVPRISCSHFLTLIFLVRAPLTGICYSPTSTVAHLAQASVHSLPMKNKFLIF